MKCEEIKCLIDLYVSHELSTEEEKVVSEHLKVCPNCSRLYHEAEEFSRSLEHAFELLNPREGLENKIISAWHSAPLSRKCYPFWTIHKIVLAFGSAAAILIIAIIFLITGLPHNRALLTPFPKIVTSLHEPLRLTEGKRIKAKISSSNGTITMLLDLSSNSNNKSYDKNYHE